MPAVHIFRDFIRVSVPTCKFCTPVTALMSVLTLNVAGQTSFAADFCIFFDIVYLKTACDVLGCTSKHWYGVFGSIFEYRTIDSSLYTFSRELSS